MKFVKIELSGESASGWCQSNCELHFPKLINMGSTFCAKNNQLSEKHESCLMRYKR